MESDLIIACGIQSSLDMHCNRLDITNQRKKASIKSTTLSKGNKTLPKNRNLNGMMIVWAPLLKTKSHSISMKIAGDRKQRIRLILSKGNLGHQQFKKPPNI